MSAVNFNDFAISRMRGDTIVFTVTVARDGSAVDLTGGTMWCTGKTSLSQADNAAMFQKTTGAGIVHTTPASGLATVTIASGDTDDITEETLVYVDVQLKESNNQVTTVCAGTITLVPDVTITTT